MDTTHAKILMAVLHILLSLWYLICFDIIQNFFAMTKDWYFSLEHCRWSFYKRCVLLYQSFLFPLSQTPVCCFFRNRILKSYNCPWSHTLLETFKALSSWSIEALKKIIREREKQIQYKIYCLNLYTLHAFFIRFCLKHKSLKLA